MASRETVAFEEFYPEPLDIWFQCHCYPSDEGLSVYFHDITDRREVEVRREQLLAAEQAARSESERVARAKDDFLASLSHELRTPLAAITGWANVLTRPNIDAQTLRRGIDAIARNADAQSQLVSDLLDTSRIVSGKLRINVERLDLNMIAETAADTARPAAATKGVRIDVRLADERPLDIMGDPARLQQIVSNLLTNALKFTPEGGRVTISTAQNGARVELSVTDTGQGIVPEFLPYLFDRFSQADGSAARVHGGLGLGLSIVKSLVELHAGTVTASSAGKDRGSTFKLEFPQAAGGPAQAVAAHAGPAGETIDKFGLSDHAMPDETVDLQGVSVLVVDDNADMLEVERRLLCESGASVTTADSAEQALQHLRTTHFDVLLSDLGMPGMDGYGLIHEVRSTLGLSSAHLAAAAVTAFVRPEDRQRALQAGYQACIPKPVHTTALSRAVLDLAQGLGAAAAQVGQASSEQRRHRSPDGEPTELRVIDARGVKAPLARLRALFVEDNADLREQIGWMLEEEGLDFVACANGEDAEVEFGKGGFDVVVTDVSLPKMSGVELARRLLAQWPKTWVVFSTGYPMGDRLAALGSNVRALLKPFEAEDLHRLMNEVRADFQQTVQTTLT